MPPTMCASLPTLDLLKIQDDSRLRSIELQSIVFTAWGFPVLLFYRNPPLRVPTEERNRIRGFHQIRGSGFALSRFGGFEARRIRAFATGLTMVCVCLLGVEACGRIIAVLGD